MTALWVVYGVLFGLCLGSFANVLIYRLPRGIQFVKGHSQCTACGQRIQPYDLIPLVSFLLLRGKCRHCGEKISVRYPLVECAGGALGALAAGYFGLSFKAPLYLLVFIILLAVAVIDAEHMIIPDGLVAALAVLAVPLAFLSPETAWLYRLFGFFVLSLPMFLTNLFIKDAFGGGDIKLMAVCGFMLGLGPTLVAGFLGVLTAGSRAMGIMLSGKPYKNVHMPFGPYLCFGVLIACVLGERIVRWYLGLM